MVILLLTLAVFGGHRAARFISEPSLIPQAWRSPVGWVAAAVVFLAVSTLTQLTNTLAFSGPSSGARRFTALVGEFSVIGAILGTVLGFRVGAHLFVESSQDPARYGFSDLLATISDSVTLMTLLAVAACWPLAARLTIESAKASMTMSGLRHGGSLQSLVVLFAGNMTGYYAALLVYNLLTR